MRRYDHPPRLATAHYLAPRVGIEVYHFTNLGSSGVHWHEFYELMLIVGGHGTHALNGAAQSLVPGDLCLLTPSDIHAVTPLAGQVLEFWNIVFTDEHMRPELRELLGGVVRARAARIDAAACAELRAICVAMQAELRAAEPGYQLLVAGGLARLLVALARAAPPPVPTPRLAPPLRDAIAYMHNHFRAPLTLAAVAQQAGLSAAYFSACFHRALGVTFQHYLQQLRLQFACGLLLAAELSVTEVGHAAGFTSLSQFERTFKQCYGCTPRSYRQHVQCRPPATALHHERSHQRS